MSRAVTADETAWAAQRLRAMGFEVVLGEGVGRRHRCFSGTADERAAEWHRWMMDPTVKAVWLARGGYGATDLLDRWPDGEPPPKWVAGFSDVTALHMEVWRRWGWVTVHATMPVLVSERCPAEGRAFDEAVAVMQHRFEPVRWPTVPGSRPGAAEGVMVGGNLSVLAALVGSPSIPNLEGKILLIEEVDEYFYHFDRLMVLLRRAGLLDGLAGLVVGGLTRMRDNRPPFAFERSAYEIVRDRLPSSADYPVAMGAPVGHFPGQKPVLLGAPIRLDVGEQWTTLTYRLP